MGSAEDVLEIYQQQSSRVYGLVVLNSHSREKLNSVKLNTVLSEFKALFMVVICLFQSLAVSLITSWIV